CTVISQITDRLVAERAAPRAASCAIPHSGRSAQGAVRPAADVVAAPQGHAAIPVYAAHDRGTRLRS
ncbi:MAG: hypothetical protein M3380_02460, partial [Chloroflexota bacterium]|nr:hypothetical protein [Chloroflexota bacterium]